MEKKTSKKSTKVVKSKKLLSKNREINSLVKQWKDKIEELRLAYFPDVSNTQFKMNITKAIRENTEYEVVKNNLGEFLTKFIDEQKASKDRFVEVGIELKELNESLEKLNKDSGKTKELVSKLLDYAKEVHVLSQDEKQKKLDDFKEKHPKLYSDLSFEKIEKKLLEGELNSIRPEENDLYLDSSLSIEFKNIEIEDTVKSTTLDVFKKYKDAQDLLSQFDKFYTDAKFEYLLNKKNMESLESNLTVESRAEYESLVKKYMDSKRKFDILHNIYEQAELGAKNTAIVPLSQEELENLSNLIKSSQEGYNEYNMLWDHRLLYHR